MRRENPQALSSIADGKNSGTDAEKGSEAERSRKSDGEAVVFIADEVVENRNRAATCCTVPWLLQKPEIARKNRNRQDCDNAPGKPSPKVG